MMKMEISYPKNETKEHFICKEVAKIVLYENFNCRFVATEVFMRRMTGCSKINIDALGITKKLDKVVGIEAKASMSDFNNGFCIQAPYTYIICPSGVIPTEVIPKGIGLIYVDIEKVRFNKGMRELYGVEIIKRATKTPSLLSSRGGAKYTEFLLEGISNRNSIESVFKFNAVTARGNL